METLYGKGNRQREKTRLIHQGPDKQAPVVQLPLFPNTQDEDRSHQRHYIAPVETDFRLASWSVFMKKGLDALTVWPGRINGVQDMTVATGQRFAPHLGYKVGRTIGIVTATSRQQAVLLL